MYVPNAVELIGASLNNNGDGLCEAGETCLYAPNVGAYFGHGAVSAPCSYATAGGVAGITLEEYTNNGY
jgi:hypothetical protein